MTQSDEITKQVVSQLAQAPIFQIPWGQNLLIISKASSTKEALFYVQKTISRFLTENPFISGNSCCKSWLTCFINPSPQRAVCCFCTVCSAINQYSCNNSRLTETAALIWQNLLIISKASSTKEALFYVQKTISNNWSRAVLTHQIELGLFQRQGKAQSNFERNNLFRYFV
jgi:hypothetical protein